MEKYDVIIIGAGLAGLNAARHLVQANKNIILVEARERVGGRVNTLVTQQGQSIDMGGQWIGPGQKRMYALAKEYGLALEKSHKKGFNQFEFLAQNFHNTSEMPKFSPGVLFDALQLGLRFSLKAMLTRANMPWLRRDARALDQLSVADWLEAKAFTPVGRAFWTTFLESLFCAKATETTLLDALQQLKTVGGLGRLATAEKHFFPGGAHQVAVCLVRDLADRIVFNSPVRSIQVVDGGVMVKTEKQEWWAQKVIMAVPLPLISHIAFNPPLPEARSRLQDRLVRGRVIKSVAVFDRPYWREAQSSGLVLSASAKVNVLIDGGGASGRGVLVALTTGRHADAIAGLSATERKAVIIAHMRSAHPQLQNIEPLSYDECDWSAEDWSGGGYAARFSFGMWINSGEALRKPIGPIHWAGTETATQWRSYMEGALESGERAAREVLR